MKTSPPDSYQLAHISKQINRPCSDIQPLQFAVSANNKSNELINVVQS